MMTQQQQQQTMQPQPPSDAARLFSVEKDVAALKEGLGNLGSTMDKGFRDLATEMKARSTINWQPIAILLGVLGSIGTMGFTWINTGQGRLEMAIAKVESASQRYVPREDLDARFHVISQRRDDLQRLTDARVERIERDVDTVAKQVVPRAEHDVYRQLQQRDYDLLRNRVERVEARFEKRVDGLGRAIEKIEDRGMTRAEATNRADAQDRAVGTVRNELDEHMRAFNDRQQRRIDSLEAVPRR